MKKDRQKTSKGIFFKRAQDGFSILEVLIAMAIFAIGILAVASMQISATNGNTSARKSSEASEIGQCIIEELMTGPYTAISTSVVPFIAVTGDPVNFPDYQDYPAGYTITWGPPTIILKNPPVPPPDDVLGFSVQVTVSDPQGSIRSIFNFNRYPDVN